MRVLVLGASGFVGRHLLPELVKSGHTAVALARHPPPASPGVFPIAASALDDAQVREALKGCQATINLVGINHERGDQTYERVHVDLVKAWLHASEDAHLERVVQLSVMCARPDPVSAYHDTKYRSDQCVMAGRCPWVVVRPAIIFGSDDAFTTRVRQQVRLRVAPTVGWGRALHAPVHVDDVAQALVRSVEGRVDGQVLPLSGLRRLPYRELVSELAAQEGRSVFMPAVPPFLVRLGAWLTRWMDNPPVTLAQLTMLVEGMADDTAGSWKALGIDPRGFSAAHLR